MLTRKADEHRAQLQKVQEIALAHADQLDTQLRSTQADLKTMRHQLKTALASKVPGADQLRIKIAISDFKELVEDQLREAREEIALLSTKQVEASVTALPNQSG